MCVRVFFAASLYDRVRKTFWGLFNWEARRGGELRLRASPSVSPVSMRTCQSIHICIDPLSVPSVQAQTLARRHTHTFRQRNVLSVVRWSRLLWRVLFLKRLCTYIIAFLQDSSSWQNSVYSDLDLFPCTVQLCTTTTTTVFILNETGDPKNSSLILFSLFSPICSAIADQRAASREDRAEEHNPGVEGALVPEQQPHRVRSQILWEGKTWCYITTCPRQCFSLLYVSVIFIMDEHWQ